jgi:type III secretion system low calcium response chaperone LcrH/SycD
MALLQEQFQKFFQAVEEKYPEFLPKLVETEEKTLYSQGYSFYQKGHYRQAVEIFRLLTVRNPFEKNYWFSLASALQEEKEYGLALQAWAMTALVEQNNPLPHFHAAECYFSLNQKRDAFLALFEAKERSRPSDPLWQKITVLEDCWK